MRVVVGELNDGRKGKLLFTLLQLEVCDIAGIDILRPRCRSGVLRRAKARRRTFCHVESKNPLHLQVFSRIGKKWKSYSEFQMLS